MTTPARQGRAQHVLAVESTEQLTPHIVRVVLSGESLSDFGDNGHTDAYVKLQFPELRRDPHVHRPLGRPRRPAAAIDFVTHGDTGIAAPWAMRAVPGDELVLAGPGGGYAPDPAAAWHVFAGDLSALPAIAAALEALPGSAAGAAYLEVGDPAEILDLKCPEQVTVHWLVNPEPADTAFLARAIDEGPWPAGVQVFVHGERESVKAIRQVLRPAPCPRGDLHLRLLGPRPHRGRLPGGEARTHRQNRLAPGPSLWR